MLNYTLLTLGAVAMLFPFLWMVFSSFKPRAEIFAYPPSLWPQTWTLQNYFNVSDLLNVAQVYQNTALVTIIKTILQVYTSALLGYVFGKFRFRGREIIFTFILLTMILPLEIYVLPLYQMIVKWKLADTHAALIIPGIFSAYATFLFRQFMFTIPNDLMDAARIDGAGELYIFHRIILPLCGPVLATTIGFYFMWNWNDFLWPLIVISSSDKQMMAVALSSFVDQHNTDYGLVMAGATLSVVPVLVVFAMVQRYVVRGIALTGLK